MSKWLKETYQFAISEISITKKLRNGTLINPTLGTSCQVHGFYKAITGRDHITHLIWELITILLFWHRFLGEKLNKSEAIHVTSVNTISMG